MMQVSFLSDPQEFLKKCGNFLAESEAEHNLILSLCEGAARRLKKGEESGLRCGLLLDGRRPALAAVQAPPHNLVLSKALGPEMMPHLAETLAANDFRFPGIVGPSDVAGAFFDAWTGLTGQKSSGCMDQIIYTLKAVEMPPPVEGVFRLAKPEEAPLVGEWLAAFAKDALPKTEQVNPQDASKKAMEMIKAGRAAVWAVKDKPVAMASFSGTESVARVNGVYTPPENRGRGYASAVVAHLSQCLLDEGRKMCCLYADARNPVSNSIYRKIGYEFVGRSTLYVLGAS